MGNNSNQYDMSNIFKAYDVRGIYPEEINTDIAKRVGNAVARYLKAKTLIVGEDGRIGSPELRQAVIEGIIAAGADVVYVGQCTTPLFYFAVKQTGADGGVMMTASHNPSEYNGLKITKAGGIPLGIDEGLLDVKDLANDFVEAVNRGTIINNKELKGQYIDFLIKNSNIEPGAIRRKVVVDTGNGMASIIIKPLFDKLKIDYVPLNFEIDGRFPNRSPDPIHPGALNQLEKKVVECRADLGIAFDGDADRMIVLDEKSEIISAQYILALLWESAGGPRVVYDSRFSKSLKELFGERGTRSMVGHTNVSNMMRRVLADLGGETSGHFFFKEMNYTESAILAVLKLLKFLEKNSEPISRLITPLRKYFYSGEIMMEINNTGESGKMMEALGQKYSDSKQDKFDGLTVEYPNWWFNIRPSNTEPVVRLVVEADKEELLEEKIKELENEIKNTEINR